MTAQELSVGQRFFHPHSRRKLIRQRGEGTEGAVATECGQRFYISPNTSVKPIYQRPART